MYMYTTYLIIEYNRKLNNACSISFSVYIMDDRKYFLYCIFNKLFEIFELDRQYVNLQIAHPSCV